MTYTIVLNWSPVWKKYLLAWLWWLWKNQLNSTHVKLRINCFCPPSSTLLKTYTINNSAAQRHFFVGAKVVGKGKKCNSIHLLTGLGPFCPWYFIHGSFGRRERALAFRFCGPDLYSWLHRRSEIFWARTLSCRREDKEPMNMSSPGHVCVSVSSSFPPRPWFI